MTNNAPRLATYLAYTYAGLVVYATLYPLSGWRDIGVSPFDFLVWQWPRYWTGTDLAFNAIAYLPLGFLLTMLLSYRIQRFAAVFVVTLLIAGLSFSLETLQNWLPGRDPSMLDLWSNSIGGLVGALLGLRWGLRWLTWLSRWQYRHLSELPRAELGLLLILLWLACQLFPNAVPLGVGDVRYLLGLVTPNSFDPHRFRHMASAVWATNLIAAGLLFSLLVPGHWQRYVMIPILLVLAIILRTLGHLWHGGGVIDGGIFHWITPAILNGGSIAVAALMISLILQANFRAIFAGLALLVATVLINLTPGDPYSRLATATGLPTLFFNIQNLAHGLAAIWPFLALPYLLFVSRRL
ncbi:MAG: hypothetical protein RIR18_1133 [Pseudomonadota bacterium]|jgi:VanZ family protein